MACKGLNPAHAENVKFGTCFLTHEVANKVNEHLLWGAIARPAPMYLPLWKYSGYTLPEVKVKVRAYRSLPALLHVIRLDETNLHDVPTRTVGLHLP